MLAVAGPVNADPAVTQRIAAPYVPAGYVMEETADCGIESSGGAPDARLRCASGLGWRLMTETNAVVFPKGGYLPPDARWAFPGPATGVFLSRSQIEIVSMPDGAVRRADFNRLEQMRGVRGLPTLAVTWNAGASDPDEPLQARLVTAQGEVGEPLSGSDMRRVEGARGIHDCWRAVVLSAIRAETLPNTDWSELVRATGDASGGLTCGAYIVPALAGREAGGWRLLDANTFEPATPKVFATAEDALTFAHGD